MRRYEKYRKRTYLILAVCLITVLLGLSGCPDAKTYTVTFNTQGGSNINTIRDVNNGSKITAPEVEPTMPDHHFGGWYKNAACTDAWDFNQDTVVSDLILYAKWGHLVIYRADDAGVTGAVPVDDHIYMKDEVVTVKGNTGNLARTAYSFDAWNSAPDGNGTEYSGGATFVMDTTDVELYATWDATSQQFTTIDIVDPKDMLVCDQTIRFMFDRTFDDATVSETTVRLLDSSNAVVSSTIAVEDYDVYVEGYPLIDSTITNPGDSSITYEPATYDTKHVITITPDTILEPLETYTIDVDGVKSPDGLATADTSQEITASRFLHAYTKGTGGYYISPIGYRDGYVYSGMSGWKFLLTTNPYNFDLFSYNDNYIVKLNTSLEEQWAYSLGKYEVYSAPVIASDGTSYYVVNEAEPDTDTYSWYVYKMTANGSLDWKYQLFTDTAEFSSYNTPDFCPEGVALTHDESKVIIGPIGKRTTMTALNASDGTEVAGFSKAVKQDERSAPPVIDANGNIYIAGKQREPYSPDDNYDIGDDYLMISKYDPNGNLLWETDYFLESTDGGEEPNSGMGFNKDQSHLYAFNWDTLFCIDTATGAYVWDYPVEVYPGTYDAINIRSGMAVDENDVIYFGTKSGSNIRGVLYAIKDNGSSCSLLWEFKDGGFDYYNVPIIGDDGSIYLGSEGSRFSSHDMTTGSLNWSIGVPYGADITHSSGVMDENGTVYIGNMRNFDRGDASGYIFAIDTEAGSYDTDAAWPNFQGGNANTGHL